MSTNEFHDLRQNSMRAFLRELPQLWAEHPGNWFPIKATSESAWRRKSMSFIKNAISGDCSATSL
jgi:hypothetical protein